MAESLAAMAARVADLLKARGETVAVAESSSGGLVSAALLAIPGASAYYVGGGVIYTRDARRGLLAAPDGVIAMRASTEEYALLTARMIRDRLGTTWGLAESGASGPAGNRYGDAAGHSCAAVVGPAERAATLETGIAAREDNMWRFAAAALDLFESVLRDAS